MLALELRIWDSIWVVVGDETVQVQLVRIDAPKLKAKVALGGSNQATFIRGELVPWCIHCRREVATPSCCPDHAAAWLDVLLGFKERKR